MAKFSPALYKEAWRTAVNLALSIFTVAEESAEGIYYHHIDSGITWLLLSTLLNLRDKTRAPFCPRLKRSINSKIAARFQGKIKCGNTYVSRRLEHLSRHGYLNTGCTAVLVHQEMETESDVKQTKYLINDTKLVLYSAALSKHVSLIEM